MTEEIKMTENSEASIVAAAAGIGATAASLATVAATVEMPIEAKTIVAIVAGVLGAVAAGLGAFWKAKVNITQVPS